MTKSEDLILMTQQDDCYEKIKEFLKGEMAIKGNVTGINVWIQDGYINAEWHFGNRTKGDIKDDI